MTQLEIIQAIEAKVDSTEFNDHNGEHCMAKIEAYTDCLALIKQQTDGWVSVEKELPPSDKEVLCTNSKYKHQWVGVYAKFHGIVIEDDFDEVGGLDIDGDVMYLQEGWYELTEQHHGSYDEMYLDRTVTHWQPLLPKPNTI